MKKIAALLIIAFALLVSIPTAFANGKPTNPTPNVISCQQTVWVAESTAAFTSQSLTLHIKLMALRDASTNVYCDEVKTETILYEDPALCYGAGARVYINGASLLTVQDNKNIPCGSQGYLVQTSPTTLTSGVLSYGEGYDIDDIGAYGNITATPYWTTN